MFLVVFSCIHAAAALPGMKSWRSCVCAGSPTRRFAQVRLVQWRGGGGCESCKRVRVCLIESFERLLVLDPPPRHLPPWQQRPRHLPWCLSTWSMTPPTQSSAMRPSRPTKGRCKYFSRLPARLGATVQLDSIALCTLKDWCLYQRGNAAGW